MPTVPGLPQAGSMGEYAAQQDQRPTPEQLLMTAADMQARGQLYDQPVSYKDPKASLRLPHPGGRSGARSARPHRK